MTHEGFKYFVHETLEGGRFIAKANGHHQELAMAFMSVKRSFRNIRLYPNLVLARAEIEFNEELSKLELIQKVINDPSYTSMSSTEGHQFLTLVLSRIRAIQVLMRKSTNPFSQYMDRSRQRIHNYRILKDFPPF